jgi:hypothetical protein
LKVIHATPSLTSANIFGVGDSIIIFSSSS